MNHDAHRPPLRDPDGAAQALAADILKLCQSTLLVDLRFLAPALSRLTPIDDGQTVTLATDGGALRYNPVYVLRRWQADRAGMVRSYLHMALHCVYHHPFVDAQGILPACWDLACDIAVEASIDALSLSAVRTERSAEAELTLSALRRALGDRLTAERIYRHYADQRLNQADLDALRAPFLRDEHGPWYARSKGDPSQSADSPDDGNDGEDGDGGSRQPGDRQEEQQGGGDAQEQRSQPPDDGAPQPDAAQLKADWDRIAARVQTDLETHSRQWADRAGGLLINLRAARRSRMRLRDFLLRFAALTETPEADPDSFDPIFYTYGLRLYGNMPLIEPQETSEQPRIRDFVIVLDTSASVQGERVQAFLARTCDILLTERVFDSRMRLHILECDAAVQRETVITTPQELADFTLRTTLRGRGGTDFRPAFERVGELVARGELPGLRGMLYLTDGDGTYPAQPPPCETAMLFVDQEDAQVPPWAIRVLIDAQSLDQPVITCTT